MNFGKQNKKSKPSRSPIVIRLCGPARAVAQFEAAKLGYGGLKKVLETSLMEMHGPKYPKLMERFKILQEEKA